MSRGGSTLALKITGDAKDGIRALDDADGAAGRFGGTLGKVAAGAGIALGAIGVLGKAAFDSASNLQQQAGAVDAVFGDGAAKMHEYAAQAAKTVGLANSEYSELAAVLGAQLSNAGYAGDQLTGTVDDLVRRGGDLAAQFGGSTADAVAALSSVLKGETDPIERYGVSLKQSDINARLAAQGQDKLTGAALKNATAAAALALVTEQTTSSVGAFARESGTAAGSGAVLNAQWENLKAKLGAGLLPLFATAAAFISERVIPAVENLFRSGGPLAEMFAQVGAFIMKDLIPSLSSLWNELAPKLLPILNDMGRVIVTYLVPAFRAVWGIVQDYVVPIFRSVLGPALDGISKVWKSVSDALDRNREKFAGVLESVRPLLEFLRDKVAPFVGGALKANFEVLGTVIGKVIDAIAWVLDKAGAVAGFIGKVGNAVFGAPAPAGGPVAAGGVLGAAPGGLLAATSPLVGVAGGGSTTSGQGLITAGDTHVTINIPSGFVGSESQLADAIGRMLDARSRRVGSAPAFGGVRIA